MRHKRLKKLSYFWLIERRLAKSAALIRAVSLNEQANLQKMFKKAVCLIENGVKVPQLAIKNLDGPLIYLFMARLHHKKGILPLVNAWSAENTKNSMLIIAGPDEGELENILPIIKRTPNIQYVGAVYGDDKRQLLEKSHYYILPSYSEGFPTSVVEAMSYGLIPIISPECNFAAVFENKLGYCVYPREENIRKVLRVILDKEFDVSLSERNRQFVVNNNSEEFIGSQFAALYRDMLETKL